MRKWLGFDMQAREIFSSEEARRRLVLLQAVRLGFYSVVLFITVAFQIRQPDFIGYSVVGPLYSLLSAVFFLNALYTFFLRSFVSRLFLVTAALFAIDALFITGLIYYTEFNQSIFLFMYLINIILCGLVFQRPGAIMLALLTSLGFSFLIVVGPPLTGPTLYFTVGINNIAFFAVAYLSGYLSEQINFMGSEIRARDADIQVLQNLNRMIVENIATGLMTVQSDGRILHSNPAARNILEQGDDLLKMNLSQVFPEVMNRMRTLRFDENSKNLARFEIIYVTPRSERLLLGCSVSPLKEAEDVPADNTKVPLSGYVLIFQDLTEIKRLERAVQRSEKLAAVGKLAAGIAHEIRNPLASISGSIQLLKTSSSPRTHDEERLMAIAIKEIDRLNLLISEFLDFVRPEQSVEKVIDLEALMKEVLDMTRVNTRLRQDIEQKMNFKNHRRVLGNPDKLKQVLLNLVINAYQAMEKTEKPVLTVLTSFDRGLVRLKIQDNGIGMSEAVVKRLFEPFFTTKHNGTGLGLATTHKILESHEARVYVESAEGKGTEFALEFTKLAPVEELVDNRAEISKRGHG